MPSVGMMKLAMTKLAKLSAPDVAKRPRWLAEQLETLRHDEPDLAASHPLAIESADLLVRACLAATQASLTVTLEKAPLGHVIVDWKMESGSLQWEVQAARIPWPGVEVNALVFRDAMEEARAHTRVFHTAFEGPQTGFAIRAGRRRVTPRSSRPWVTTDRRPPSPTWWPPRR